ncbi:MAG: hypothetical protein QMC80_00500 [Thermoplasmatales archaeon]|nr:hypothetical protein [Thermoplasmatales archaeon]
MNNNGMKLVHTRSIPSSISLRKSKDGQASAVGAMLTVIIVIIVLSMITLYYVPVWMEEKERNHMNTVQKEFMDLSATVSSLIINNDKSSEGKNTVVLGNEGIPFFSIGTMGTLKIDPYTPSFHVYNETKILNVTSTGNIRFEPQNRYFVKQNFVYENGAVIIDQSGGEVVRVEPTFNVSGSTVSMTLISISGTNESMTGKNAQTVIIKLMFYESDTYTWSGENITISITTMHQSAWQNYFNKKGCNTTMVDNNVVVNLNDISTLTIRYAAIKAEIVHP